MKKKMKRKEMKSNIGWKQMRKVVRRKRSVGNEIKDNTKRKGGWRRREIAALRKLCAYSKDRFKVYGRRIIPFIVLVNPEIYTPWFSPFLQPVSLSLSLSSSPLRPLPPLSLSIYLSLFRLPFSLVKPGRLPLIPFHFTIIFYEPSSSIANNHPQLLETSGPTSQRDAIYFERVYFQGNFDIFEDRRERSEKMKA